MQCERCEQEYSGDKCPHCLGQEPIDEEPIGPLIEEATEFFDESDGEDIDSPIADDEDDEGLDYYW